MQGAPSGPDPARMLSAAEELAHMGSWMLDLDTREGAWSDELYRIHGLEAQSVPASIDLLLEHVHPEDRDRAEAVLRRVVEAPETIRPEGVSGEYRIVRADGAVRDLRFHGRIDPDGVAHRGLWVGSAQDVTEQRLTERELRAHYAVGQALNEWESFEEGVVGLLRRVGTALEYPLAVLWLWSEEQSALFCRAFWSEPGLEPGPFEEVCRRMRFRPGEGRTGIAWQDRQPVFVADVAKEAPFEGRDAALAVGVRSSLSFPAVGSDGPVAVLTVYGLEPRTASESLLHTLTVLGRQLGRFLSRRRGQLEPRRLSDRELEVLRFAAAGRSGPAIAEALVISPSTVKTHFENIYDKLGVSDRAAAVAYALRGGLIH